MNENINKIEKVKKVIYEGNFQNFILAINKTSGPSSFDIIRKLKKITKIKKIGHGGTLDPLADGVLVVAFGNYTKKLTSLLSGKKEYICTGVLGFTSDTFDITGVVKKIESKIDVTEKNLNLILKQFKGEILQKPPIYSALKFKGKRLYELARKSEKIEIAPRKVVISNIKLIKYKKDLEFTYQTECLGGCYIRSLTNDIGEKLNTGAVMKSLTRTRVSNFFLENSFNLFEFEKIWDSFNKI